MNILHINSYYPFSDLYRQMMLHFECMPEYQHIVYVPVPTNRSIPNRAIQSANVNVIYSTDYRYIDRWRYHYKRKKTVNAIERQVDISKITIMHAHHLFTAGGVAYELKQRYKIPYIVAVRNTDINCFFRYALHLRHIGLAILQGASSVVFISPAGYKAMSEYIGKEQWKLIMKKSIIIPNGVDDYWLDNPNEGQKQFMNGKIKILYVGQINRNKNVGMVIAASNELKRRGYSNEVCIVGAGPDMKRISKIAKKSNAIVNIAGKIESKEELKKYYRSSNIFIMPSINETFGLVYLEAMSQGLPVIYSFGQGIDGYFKNGEIGYACDPHDCKQIANATIEILEKLTEVSNRCINEAQKFSWTKIVRMYENVYEDTIRTTYC